MMLPFFNITTELQITKNTELQALKVKQSKPPQPFFLVVCYYPGFLLMPFLFRHGCYYEG